MKLKVNPTRQELLKIKKRLKTAKSGHGLLKEKLDGLMQEFLSNIKELKRARQSLDDKIPSAFYSFYKSSSRVGEDKIDSLTHHLPLAKVKLSFYSVMGVSIRRVEVDNKEEVVSAEISMKASDSDLKKAGEGIVTTYEDILSYANLIIKTRMLAEEIERTRRRVNSLEHIYIPEMERVMKYIAQKLEERERFDRTVVLKLKELMQ